MMRLYFDANALIKFYRDERGSQWLRRTVAQHQVPVLLSALTVVEFYGVLALAQRTGKLRPSKVRQIDQRLRRDVGVRGYRPFQRIPVDEQAWSVARTILLNYGRTAGIGSKDSLHLATAHLLQRSPALSEVRIVTSDAAMKSVCEHLKLPSVDPEREEDRYPPNPKPAAG
jgi:predicted nucleic acid-binding protein